MCNPLQRLSSIGHDILSSNPEDEWRKTLSGKIYSQVESIARRLGKSAEIEDKGGILERFRIGNEEVTLSKRLIDGTVGEDGGTIQTYAEAWEYKKIDWWKEALDKEGLPVILLDTSVVHLAEDAQIDQLKEYFIPSEVIKKYGLNPKHDSIQQISMEEWVKQQIKETLNPLLAPHYEVRDFEKQLRLKAMTHEALESLKEDNAVYHQAMDAIRLAHPELEKRYLGKSKNIN